MTLLLLFGESAQVGIRFIKAPLEQFPFSKHGSQLPLPGPCTESTAIVWGTGDRLWPAGHLQPGGYSSDCPQQELGQLEAGMATTAPLRHLPCSGPESRQAGRPSCSTAALLQAIMHHPCRAWLWERAPALLAFVPRVCWCWSCPSPAEEPGWGCASSKAAAVGQGQAQPSGLNPPSAPHGAAALG